MKKRKLRHIHLVNMGSITPWRVKGELGAGPGGDSRCLFLMFGRTSLHCTCGISLLGKIHLCNKIVT